MKKTFIEFKDVETNKVSTRLIYGEVSVIMGINTVHIVHHDENQKTDIIDTTGKIVIVRNWGN